MKKCITFYEAQTAVRLKKITQPHLTHPPYHQILLLLWNKNFHTEIYRHLPSKCFKNCCSSWASRNGTAPFLQFFSDTKQKHVCCKICKVKKGFGYVVGAYYFQWGWLRFRFIKWMRFFDRNCIVKWVTFFASFCWFWDFLLEHLKLRLTFRSCPLERADVYKKIACPK